MTEPTFAPEGHLDGRLYSHPVTRWWWIRHAPVVDAHLMRLSGQNDVAADTSDAAAFARLAAHLPGDAVWVTSNLRRTRQTAEALWAAGAARPHGAGEPLVEADFAEQAFGDWTGCTWGELGELPEAAAFWQSPATVAPPAAAKDFASESFADQCARVAARMDALMSGNLGGNLGRDIIAVTHGGTIRAALAHALGLTPAQALAVDVANLGLTRLDHIADGPPAANARTRRGGNWRVVGVNQVW